MSDQAHTKHSWSAEDRQMLGVMLRFYVLSHTEMARIFNEINIDVLQREGFSCGLSTRSIVAQFNDLKHSSRGATEFRPIQQMKFETARESYEEQREQIELIARRLKMVIKLRVNETMPQPSDAESETNAQSSTQNTSSFSINPSSETNSCPDVNSSSDVSSSSDSESSSASETSSWVTESEVDNLWASKPDHNFSASTSSRIPPQLRLEWDRDLKSAPKRPRLLFRAFQPSHSLRARKFQNVGVIPPPPVFGTPHFERTVYPHLCEDHTYQSPLLSFAENPARALRIIRNSSMPLDLAIIDYNELEAELRSRYGSASGPWLVARICKEFGFNDLRLLREHSATHVPRSSSGYTGVGEIISWGSVEHNIVGRLDYTSALRLLSCMENVKNNIGEVCRDAGKEIGSHIQDVQAIYREVVAYKLVRAFKVRGRNANHDGERYLNFVEGVYEATSPPLNKPPPKLEQFALNTSNWTSYRGNNTFTRPMATNCSSRQALAYKTYVNIPRPVFDQEQDLSDEESAIQRQLDAQLGEGLDSSHQSSQSSVESEKHISPYFNSTLLAETELPEEEGLSFDESLPLRNTRFSATKSNITRRRTFRALKSSSTLCRWQDVDKAKVDDNDDDADLKIIGFGRREFPALPMRSKSATDEIVTPCRGKRIRLL